MADITKNPIFTDEAAARAHLETLRWPQGDRLPALRCLRRRHFRCSENSQTPQADARGQALQARARGRYYCKDCEGTFTVTVGTVMEDSGGAQLPIDKAEGEAFQSSRMTVSAFRPRGISHRTWS